MISLGPVNRWGGGREEEREEKEGRQYVIIFVDIEGKMCVLQ